MYWIVMLSEVETSVFQSERFFVPIHRDQNDNRTILFGHPLFVLAVFVLVVEKEAPIISKGAVFLSELENVNVYRLFMMLVFVSLWSGGIFGIAIVSFVRSGGFPCIAIVSSVR
ncbi:hypothetical protein QUH73_13940 [Labilibaculum sp. K2S]|uniref:hypothetical protein n=1 Tax=Labilibaculum sp. K2S TaxID=3056386 RepID=UPI0025A40639|nr:hypothetical protein [Labilibaculum sp. K2S]MDM8160921.1 hypothetical protein [Labilibaculum sp. K2S]